MTSTAKTNGRTTRGFDLAEYQALVKSFPPRPIRDETQLRRTWAQIDVLLAKARRSPAEDDYLVVLSDMVEHWEADHIKMPKLHGVELVRELLDDNQLPQRALVNIFGADSIVSEVLSGRRELQRKHIEGLARLFNVSPAAFFPTLGSGRSPAPGRGSGRALSTVAKRRSSTKAK